MPRRAAGRAQSPDAPICPVAPNLTPQVLILDGYPSEAQQNVLGPNSGSRRWGVAEMRKSVQAQTAVEVRNQRIRPVAPPVHAIYRFVVPDRTRRDWDNYALICKPVQDGLVKSKILVGDHFAVLTAQVEFRVEKGRRRLEVVIAQALGGPAAAPLGREGT